MVNYFSPCPLLPSSLSLAMLADLLVFYCRLTGLSLAEVPLAVELIAEEVT